MSGIVGILHRDGAPADRELLRRLTHSLAFRGPDALEIWATGPVGFGHAMLRTTDEAATERQPASLDGQVWITGDARVDARTELIAKLGGQGRHCSDTVTDPELILHAYDVWGEECVRHLVGDFVFAIWDGRRQRLFCARDHFGVKPFYYAALGSSFIFSNTLNCVRLHPDVSDELNDQAIGDFLLFEFNQDSDTTTFADIRRLPPAHTLTWHKGTVRVACYWTLPVDEPVRYKRASDCLDHFQEVFQRAVADRLRTGRVGVLMSGGLDSTSVAAVAKRLLSERELGFDLRAYTVVHDELILDEEGRYAGIAASALGIPIHYASSHMRRLYERQDQPELFSPEPLHDPLAALDVGLYQQVGAQCRVAMTGDGGDILLYPQSGPYIAHLLRRRQFGHLISEVGWYFLSHRRIPPPLVGIRSKIARWLGKPSLELAFPTWLNPDFATRLHLRERFEELNQTPAGIHPFRPDAYRTLQGPFWSCEFESLDAAVTLSPMDIRFPFFDLRVVRLLLALPPLPWCVDKELLRRAMRGILPEEIRQRPKTPLLGDPVLELLKRPGLGSLNHLEPVPALAQYVVRDEASGVRGNADSEELWVNLRPVSLNYWLLQNSLFLKYKCVREENVEVTRSQIS